MRTAHLGRPVALIAVAVSMLILHPHRVVRDVARWVVFGTALILALTEIRSKLTRGWHS